MYTIRTIPISRSTGLGELTYYSVPSYPVGAILHAPIRGKEVPVIVWSVEELHTHKALIKSAEYQLKRLKRQVPSGLLTPEFVKAVMRTAFEFATPPAPVLSAYTPKVMLMQDSSMRPPEITLKPALRGFIVPRLFQGMSEERVAFFRTAIRESFAAHGSALLIVPTRIDAERIYHTLTQGIERYAYLLHGSLSLKEQKKRVTDILTNEHPVLCVCTPTFMSLPRPDIATILIEREGSPLYRERYHTTTDARVLAEHLATELGGQLLLADIPLRIESMYRKDVGEYEEVMTGNQRTTFPTYAKLISLKGEGREPKKAFRAIGRDLLAHICTTACEQNKSVFLYVARRGLSPSTLCGDCGMSVLCAECGMTVVLHKGTSENYFLCHACGAMRHARERCAHCHSWRLETFGIGAELVERELKELLPHTNTLLLTSDTAPTYTTALAIATQFYEQPGSILIGTELALPYLYKHIPLVGVVSIDALLSLAHWNVYERIASTLTRLREVTSEGIVVQTRHPEHDILSNILSGNFSAYYRSELSMRKKMGYPPYAVLVKVSTTGSETEVVQRMEIARNALAPHVLIPYERILRAQEGKLTLHGFIRIAREEWPHAELIAKLCALPQTYTIAINPDSIL